MSEHESNDVHWCAHCGEGVSTFCRQRGEGHCPKQLHRVIHKQVKDNPTPPSGQAAESKT